ncbi:MAG: DNA polymerase III subunit gamma/tau, partial [Bacteroidota bacterium]
MQNFVVSARKYRPAIFDHVLGQPHITTTLKNALRDQHLAQAFLFCGPRGVGKTTCARILAKAINCQQITKAIEPCNTCASCTSFNNHSSLNVYELDAASNNSVEDIRALVDQVRYPPQSGKYKTYIIDEVHMLSSTAFNAFLKTLEEPPSYAIFILATTEKHKIIPTILSRCQIFDFHRIQPLAIVQQLKHIAQQEGITYEEEALHLIGQKADGALRDALSIFDLITTFAAGQPLTYQATLAHLHILDHEYYFKLIDACLQRDVGKALLLYDEILKAGFDGHHFVTGLSEHLRNLMVCQDQATLALLEVADNVKAQYQAQAVATGTPFLLQAL